MTRVDFVQNLIFPHFPHQFCNYGQLRIIAIMLTILFNLKILLRKNEHDENTYITFYNYRRISFSTIKQKNITTRNLLVINIHA